MEHTPISFDTHTPYKSSNSGSNYKLTDISNRSNFK